MLIRKTICSFIAITALLGFVLASQPSISSALDPCGMVPPIYTGPGVPIVRTGLQKTYVFYKDGVETFVIRPGFQGKVEDFGMLIPFPTPPALRKVPDNIFEQIDNAIDPPEVVVDLRMWQQNQEMMDGDMDIMAPAMQLSKDNRNEVQVLKKKLLECTKSQFLRRAALRLLKNGWTRTNISIPMAWTR